MPICHKCDNRFPNRIIVDGKRRILSSRKYCLKCSPFGQRNRKQLESHNKTINCNICNRKYQYTRTSGHTLKYCNSCMVNHRRFLRKKKMVEYKGGKCQRCGYDKCLAAFDFHHRDPKGKEFNISGNHCIAWNKLRKELDKCDLVCSNCHREIGASNSRWQNANEEEKERRKLKSKISCFRCGKETSNSKYCSHDCAEIGSRKVSRPSKRILLKDIQTMTYTAIGKKYGVSDNAIRKWEKQY